MRVPLLAHKLSALMAACGEQPSGNCVKSAPISIIDSNADGVLKLRYALTGVMPTDVWVGHVADDIQDDAVFFWADLDHDEHGGLFGVDWSSLNETLQDVTITDANGDGLLTQVDLVGLDANPPARSSQVVLVGEWDHLFEVRILPGETSTSAD